MYVQERESMINLQHWLVYICMYTYTHPTAKSIILSAISMLTYGRYEEDSLEGDFSLRSEVGLGERVRGILREQTIK